METGVPRKRSTVPEQTLEDFLANRARECYITYQKLLQDTRSPDFKLQGVYDADKKGTWDKIADFMLKHDLNLEHCMWVRFQLAVGRKADKVFPEQIAQPKYLSLYQEECSGLVERFASRKQTEARLCSDYMLSTAAEFDYTGRDLYRFVLLDDALELSALFRYCLAKSEGLKDVARRYKNAAWFQYLPSSREYDEAWGEWIPRYFRECAASLREES